VFFLEGSSLGFLNKPVMSFLIAWIVSSHGLDNSLLEGHSFCVRMILGFGSLGVSMVLSSFFS